MPRFQLVVPGGEPLGAAGHDAIGPLALCHAVLRLRSPASGSLTCLHPLLLRDPPLDVGQGSWEGCHLRCRPFLRRDLSPLIYLRHLACFDLELGFPIKLCGILT